MNRLIKFRIPWFNADGSFSHFSYWGTIDHRNEPSLDHGSFTSPGMSSGYRKGWHEQFTGLLDKNGKEIFEGDVVRVLNCASDWRNDISYVVFEQGAFQLEHDGMKKLPPVLHGWIASFVKIFYDAADKRIEPEFEITGTIHDKSIHTPPVSEGGNK